MSNESAACQHDPGQDDVGPEPVIGTLVEVWQNGDLVVELDGLDGEKRRCRALTTVPIEAGMVGRPVELKFVGDLDRPVITRVIDVRAVLREQWDALGRKVLRLDPNPVKLSALVLELWGLACTAAWLDADGSVTRGAMLGGTSRRTFRLHVRRWTRNNPRLVSAPKLEQRAGRRRVARAGAQPTTKAAPPPAGGDRREAK
jgi:Domain of unknown function (DUF6484)